MITLTKEELLKYLEQAYEEGFYDGDTQGNFYTSLWEDSNSINIPDEIGDVIE